jgi:hypothetical protein
LCPAHLEYYTGDQPHLPHEPPRCACPRHPSGSRACRRSGKAEAQAGGTCGISRRARGDEGRWPSAAGGRTARELDCGGSRSADDGSATLTTERCRPRGVWPHAHTTLVRTEPYRGGPAALSRPRGSCRPPPARSAAFPPRATADQPRRGTAPLLRAHTSRNALRWENDAILHCTSLGMQNAFPVWVLCWRTILIPKVTMSNLFYLWVAIWVSCWSQPYTVDAHVHANAPHTLPLSTLLALCALRWCVSQGWAEHICAVRW